jgi:hypothetical protein
MAPQRANAFASQLRGIPFDHTNDQRNYAEAVAYVMGISDALNNKLFCARRRDDIVEPVIAYLESHHSVWDQPASYVVEQALMERYPCASEPSEWKAHSDFLLNYRIPPNI